MQFQYLTIHKDPAAKIETVVMNTDSSPDAVPWSAEDELLSAIDDWERDDDVKVVVLKASGDNFGLGHPDGDVLPASLLQVGSPEDAKRVSNRARLWRYRHSREALRRLLLSLKPTIAQVHGKCLDFSCVLAACCDITVAAEDAQFGEPGQAILFSGISAQRLYIALVGHKRTHELLGTAQLVSGKKAEEWGLVNRSVPRDRLDQEVLRLAQRIALLPLDGIITGKAFTHMVYDSMGLGATFIEDAYGPALGMNIRPKDDEFDYFKVAEEKGAQEARGLLAARLDGR